MSGAYHLGRRLILAAAVFCAIGAVVAAVPGFITGDLEAITLMLALGGGMGLALFAALLMIALPLYIIFGRRPLNATPSRKPLFAVAGATVAFLLAGTVLGGFSGSLSTAAVFLLSAAGAIAGWLLAPRRAA